MSLLQEININFLRKFVQAYRKTKTFPIQEFEVDSDFVLSPEQKNMIILLLTNKSFSKQVMLSPLSIKFKSYIEKAMQLSDRSDKYFHHFSFVVNPLNGFVSACWLFPHEDEPVPIKWFDFDSNDYAITLDSITEHGGLRFVIHTNKSMFKAYVVASRDKISRCYRVALNYYYYVFMHYYDSTLGLPEMEVGKIDSTKIDMVDASTLKAYHTVFEYNLATKKLIEDIFENLTVENKATHQLQKAYFKSYSNTYSYSKYRVFIGVVNVDEPCDYVSVIFRGQFYESGHQLEQDSLFNLSITKNDSEYVISMKEVYSNKEFFVDYVKFGSLTDILNKFASLFMPDEFRSYFKVISYEKVLVANDTGALDAASFYLKNVNNKINIELLDFKGTKRIRSFKNYCLPLHSVKIVNNHINFYALIDKYYGSIASNISGSPKVAWNNYFINSSTSVISTNIELDLNIPWIIYNWKDTGYEYDLIKINLDKQVIRFYDKNFNFLKEVKFSEADELYKHIIALAIDPVMYSNLHYLPHAMEVAWFDYSCYIRIDEISIGPMTLKNVHVPATDEYVVQAYEQGRIARIKGRQNEYVYGANSTHTFILKKVNGRWTTEEVPSAEFFDEVEKI